MGSLKRVAIVVPCTDRKTRPVDMRRLSKLAHLSDALRFERWRDLLTKPGGRIPAGQLYCGVGWSAGLAVARTAQVAGLEAEVWVVSAGYGLLKASTPVLSYGASFDPRSQDPICRTSHAPSARRANQGWWARLADWRLGNDDTPRSLQELAQSVHTVILALSHRYLEACEQDLMRASASGNVMVVVSGLDESHPLGRQALRFDRRLREGREGCQPLIRANDVSLNARVAEHLFQVLGPLALCVDQAQRYLDAQMGRRPARRSYKHRAPATDGEVHAFIQRRLRADPDTKKTTLLRDWRDQGKRCEQKRFGEIFAAARSELKREPHDG